MVGLSRVSTKLSCSRRYSFSPLTLPSTIFVQKRSLILVFIFCKLPIQLTVACTFTCFKQFPPSNSNPVNVL